MSAFRTPSIALVAEGWPLLFFHGSPDDFNVKLLPTTPDEAVREALAAHSERAMAAGDTHLRMLRRIDAVALINPGSVGMAYDSASDNAGLGPGPNMPCSR